VAAMMGHSSTAMVDRVYGKLDEMSFRRAIAKLPQRAESSAGEAPRPARMALVARPTRNEKSPNLSKERRYLLSCG
jgi:hypothetical protein